MRVDGRAGCPKLNRTRTSIIEWYRRLGPYRTLFNRVLGDGLGDGVLSVALHRRGSFVSALNAVVFFEVEVRLLGNATCVSDARARGLLEAPSLAVARLPLFEMAAWSPPSATSKAVT